MSAEGEFLIVLPLISEKSIEYITVVAGIHEGVKKQPKTFAII